MANKTVNIYERVKVQGKWTDRSVPIPKLKADGTMYLKDDREGKSHIEKDIDSFNPTIYAFDLTLTDTISEGRVGKCSLIQ
ncbi:MAG: hypothetical protein WCB11_05055 [Terriglobales bacterium]